MGCNMMNNINGNNNFNGKTFGITGLMAIVIFCGLMIGNGALQGVAQAAGNQQQPTKESNIPVLDWQYATGNWFGLRDAMGEKGITLEPSIVFDYSKLFSGGRHKYTDATRHVFNVNLSIDTEKLFGLKGGTFFVDFMNINGQNGSDKVGDFQSFSNIDSPGRTEVAELWYQQMLFDNKLRIKIGKVDANLEFDYVENGCDFVKCDFINSSMGFSPTIFVFPTYPDPAMSFNAFVYPDEHLYMGFGVYDGSGAEGIQTGSRGPKTFFGSPGDLFYIGEAGLNYTLGQQKLTGRIAGGGWWHDGTFNRFDGSQVRGTGGFYALLDQSLWKENPDNTDDQQGIGSFLQYGWANNKVSEAQDHFGAGITYTGAIPNRDDDVCGVGISCVHFTSAPAAGFTDSYETSYEAFYKLQLTDWASIKPDLQYIANPGGQGLNHAFVGTVRVEIGF